MLTVLGEQNFQMCAQTVFRFRFCKWRKKSCNACQCSTLCTQFFEALKSRAGRKFRLSAQAVKQMLFRPTKNTHSLQSKISQSKSSGSETWRNVPLFSPWVEPTCDRTVSETSPSIVTTLLFWATFIVFFRCFFRFTVGRY